MIERYVVPVYDGTEESRNKSAKYIMEGMQKYDAPIELIIYYSACYINGSTEEFIEANKIIVEALNAIISEYEKLDKLQEIINSRLVDTATSIFNRLN